MMKYLIVVVVSLLIAHEGISYQFIPKRIISIRHHNFDVPRTSVVKKRPHDRLVSTIFLSWSPHSLVSSLFPASTKERTSSKDERKNKSDQQNDDSSFGQSFIGQDVCGSKYNDDPFDAVDGKEDAWKTMQRKIAAIEESNRAKNEKIKQKEEKRKEKERVRNEEIAMRKEKERKITQEFQKKQAEIRAKQEQKEKAEREKLRREQDLKLLQEFEAKERARLSKRDSTLTKENTETVLGDVPPPPPVAEAIAQMDSIPASPAKTVAFDVSDKSSTKALIEKKSAEVKAIALQKLDEENDRIIDMNMSKKKDQEDMKARKEAAKRASDVSIPQDHVKIKDTDKGYISFSDLDIMSDIGELDLDEPIELKKGAGGLLNSKIISILTTKALGPRERENTVRRLIEVNDKLVNHVHVTTILQRCAKNRLKSNRIISLEQVVEILQKDNEKEKTKNMNIMKARKNKVAKTATNNRNAPPIELNTANDDIDGAYPGLRLDAKEISSLIYSLKLFDARTPGIEVFLQTILRFLDSCVNPFNAQHVACSFYGLQNFGGDLIQVETLMESVVKKIRSTPRKFSIVLNDQELSMSLFGFRKMQFSERLNDALLLLSQMVREDQPFSSEQGIANSLNGLQNLDASVEAQSGVRAILGKLIPKIEAFEGSLTPKGAGSAFMGLRSMSVSCPEAISVLASLNRKANSTDAVYNAPSISSMLNGLRNMDDNITEVRRTLRMITRRLQLTKDEFSAKDLSNAAMGLNSMNSNSKALLQLLDELTIKIAQCRDPFTSLDVGLCLYGLKGMRTSPEVNRYMAEILKKMDENPIKMREKDIAISLYGLQSHEEPNSAELKAVLTKMTKKVKENPEQKFSAQSLSMVMLGLQKQKSSSVEVQEILRAVTLRMDNLDGQAIGNCLYSLQKMTSDDEGVLIFLSKLAPRILTSAPSTVPNSPYFKSPVSISSSMMKPQEIANALWGLQGMNSDIIEVRVILKALTEKLVISMQRAGESKKGFLDFTAQGIGNALYGLQTMSDEVPETIELLSYFPDLIMSSTDRMTPQDIGNSFFGLQGFTADTDEVKNILSSLTVRMAEIPDDMRYEGRDIGHCLSGLSNKDQEIPEVATVLQELSLRLAQSKYGAEANPVFVQSGKYIKVRLNQPLQEIGERIIDDGVRKTVKSGASAMKDASLDSQGRDDDK